MEVLIKPTGTLSYSFLAAASGASLTGTTNPVLVTLTIGKNSGTTSVPKLADVFGDKGKM
jgi:hypothetical protein